MLMRGIPDAIYSNSEARYWISPQGVKKLEWWGNPAEKEVRRYLQLSGYNRQTCWWTDRQTDRRTDTEWQQIPLCLMRSQWVHVFWPTATTLRRVTNMRDIMSPRNNAPWHYVPRSECPSGIMPRSQCPQYEQ